jgi:hypothetical protein
MKHLLALCVVAMSVTTGAAYGQTYYDASQFGKSDICLSIQAAIAALPSSSTLPATAGMVIDARNFRPVAPATTLACTINPFTLTNSLNQGLNPIRARKYGQRVDDSWLSGRRAATAWLYDHH